MKTFDSIIGKQQLKVLNYSGGCSSCPRKVQNFVPATLKNTKIIIVGEAPGELEVEKGEGFVGKTGQFLRKSLQKVGITEYSLTNTIHCRPPNNRNPNDTEISCCMNQYVMKEVEGYPIVVLVGAVPTKAFFPNERFKNLRNNVVWHPDYPGQRFYPIYHPGYITRNKTKEVLRGWKRTMERLSRIEKEESTCPWTTYHGDHAVFMDKLEEMLSNKSFTFDLETNQSVKSWHPDSRIISFSVCVNDKEALFCHEEDLVWNKALNRVAQALEDKTKTVVAHNAGFDIDFMEHKCDVKAKCKILDTQRLFYLSRQERMPSLKYLTAEYLDGYRFLVGAPGEVEDISLLANYNCEDVVRTYQLAKMELPRISKKQKDLLLRVSSPAGLALQRLTSTGFYFDIEECERSDKQLTKEKQQIIDKWKKYDPIFDPEKHLDGDGLVWYLYTHKNLEVINLTSKAKKPSTDKHTIGELQRKTKEDFLSWLIRLKAIDKFQNTYIEEYLNGNLVDFDQRVHASYGNTATKTGRANSWDPNGQNITRDDTIKKSEIEGISKPFSIRKFFTVRDGNILLHADFSQIEVRIAMCLSQDPVGIKTYQEEGDAHWKTARMIAAGEGREATKVDRTHAKPTNFGLIYCHKNEAYTLKKNAKREYGIDLTDSQSKKYSETFFGTYKRIRPWQNEVVQTLRANGGYLETILGHGRYYPDFNSSNQNARDAAEREAINLTCQSPAGYITLYTLYLFQQELINQGLDNILTVSSIHDSILAEVPEELLDTVINILQYCVRKVEKWISWWFVVPLVMEYEIGPNWSELEEYEPS